MAAVVAFGALVFWATAAHTFVYSDPAAPSGTPAGNTNATAAATAASSNAAAKPARLVIPSLGISAAVEDVGLNAQGNMRAPWSFSEVTWYQAGTVPGRAGSAVMAGHVDNGLGLAGVFKDLGNLNIGDDVYVVTGSGTKLHFKVSDIQTYPHDQVPVDQIFISNDGAAHLNLITCEGTWVTGQDTYDHRLVVYTTLVSGS